MEFYVFRIRFMADGTTKKSEVMTYPTLREAEAKYHANLGSDMTDASISGGVCMVISSNADIAIKEKWGYKVEEATEEE